jgi:hypothetical protein
MCGILSSGSTLPPRSLSVYFSRPVKSFGILPVWTHSDRRRLPTIRSTIRPVLRSLSMIEAGLDAHLIHHDRDIFG